MAIKDDNKNKRRAQQLGMSMTTASSKLRKNLLFKYIKAANDNVCHKCGELIEEIDDLSIEHIQPWENRDVSLFWDMDNVAYSHIKCNRPHEYRNGWS